MSPYHKRDSKRKGHRRQSKKEFIAWDGEGTKVDEPTEHGGGLYSYKVDEWEWMFTGHERLAQPYVLLANSKGGQITNQKGLGSIECFELILNTKKEYPGAIFVGFGFNYDVNQILKDVPLDHLIGLHKTNITYVSGYRIEWLPRKSFAISHRRTKRSAVIYDTFGYFQTSFLSACRKYLGSDDKRFAAIETGKAARDQFTWEELDDFIIPYNAKELDMLVDIMDLLEKDLNATGIYPTQWYGPGAVASQVFKKFNINIVRNEPWQVLDASQYAFAGGRFEQYAVGRHTPRVYEYDIHSAYPAAATLLPDLSQGSWEHVESFEPDSFGVWTVDYCSSNIDRYSNRPEPLFCRSEHGYVSYPHQVQGQYWTPEAALVADSVQDGWVFRAGSDVRPFAFAQELYDQRRVFKYEENPVERAIKLILNSLYGKLAQTVGWNEDKMLPPRWHQLEYAGFITSYTRAKIYEAMMLAPDHIIAAETDAVFSTVPLDLSLTDNLGDWELTEFKEITYLQSGLYYAVKDNDEVICKYRGMDRAKNSIYPVDMDYDKVMWHLKRGTGFSDREAQGLRSETTRFIGLGMGFTWPDVPGLLPTPKPNSPWRSWKTSPHSIALDQNPLHAKRYHDARNCPDCQAGLSMYHTLHPTQIGGYYGKSIARHLPWRTVEGVETEAIEILEAWEEDPTIRDFAEDMEKYQPQL